MEPNVAAHADREHSDLGASSSDRWIHCHGSLNLIRRIGAISKSSIYAEAGTAAHELAHLCLLRGMDAIEYIDRRLPSWDENHEEVTDEMASAVQVYLDKCRSYIRDGITALTEQKFNLKSLNPPAPMFGTADFVAVDIESGKATIVDFKYGKNIDVQPTGPQTKYYALGVLCTLPRGTKIKTVETVIVQPRSAGPSIKTATYPISEIFQFATELMEHARATTKPDAELVAGSWCLFCPASGQCPAQRDAAYALAQAQFPVEVRPDAAVLDKDAVIGSIAAITPEQYSVILNDIPILEAFLKAVKDAARDLVSRGVQIPGGWHLEPGFGKREWQDESTIAARLTAKLGLTHDEVMVASVISPTKAEKIAVTKLREMGMKLKDAETMAKKTLEPLTYRAETIPRLVRAKGSQPGLPERGSEFTLEQMPAE